MAYIIAFISGAVYERIRFYQIRLLFAIARIAADRESLVRLSGRQTMTVSAATPACVENFRSGAWRIRNILKSIGGCSRRSANH
jgi:hypothetical protein